MIAHISYKHNLTFVSKCATLCNMANKKKKYPRSKFIIFRVTPMEKNVLEESAMELNMDFSVFIRKMLGLKEDSNV